MYCRQPKEHSARRLQAATLFLRGPLRRSAALAVQEVGHESHDHFVENNPPPTAVVRRPGDAWSAAASTRNRAILADEKLVLRIAPNNGVRSVGSIWFRYVGSPLPPRCPRFEANLGGGEQGYALVYQPRLRSASP